VPAAFPVPDRFRCRIKVLDAQCTECGGGSPAALRDGLRVLPVAQIDVQCPYENREIGISWLIPLGLRTGELVYELFLKEGLTD
jgi:hypothetical protein